MEGYDVINWVLFQSWDQGIADYAQQTVDGCVMSHGLTSGLDGTYSVVGQNLATCGATCDITDAVQRWFSEKSDYTYDLSYVFTSGIGHYSQVGTV